MKLLREWGRALEQLLFPPELPCGLCRERPALDVGACRACLDSLNIRWEKGPSSAIPIFPSSLIRGLGGV